MAMKKVKRGKLSVAEQAYVRDRAGKTSAEAMAKKLNRAPGQIQKELDEYTGMSHEVKLSLEQQLQSRPEWRQFCNHFSDEELDEFKHQYVQIMSQMKDDEVMPTEELQVFQVITLKILIDRTLKEQKMALDDMTASHKVIEKLQGVAKSESDKAELLHAAETYESSKRTNRECADRYKIYSDKQDKMLAALKATRDQRVKNLEGSKHSWVGVIRSLMEEDRRAIIGEEGALMALASEKEKKRLSSLHKYEDGTEDRPLLTPEAIINDEAD